MLEGKEGPWPGSQEAPSGARSKSLPLAEEEGWPEGVFQRLLDTPKGIPATAQGKYGECARLCLVGTATLALGRSRARSASRGQCLSRDCPGVLPLRAGIRRVSSRPGILAARWDLLPFPKSRRRRS